jgi:hypothetical protein
MTNTKIALAAVLFAATSSAALAQGYDPNLSNRYPAMAQPGNYGYSASGKLGSLQSAPVFQQRDVSLPTGTPASGGWFNVERSDRASSPYAGGN